MDPLVFEVLSAPARAGGDSIFNGKIYHSSTEFFDYPFITSYDLWKATRLN